MASAKALVVPDLSKKEKVASVMKGMLSAYGGDFNIENLLFCVYYED